MQNKYLSQAKIGVDALTKEIQKNMDATANAMEERESLRYASFPESDIRNRLKNTLETAASRYAKSDLLSRAAAKVGTSLDPGDLEFRHLISKVVRSDGGHITAIDPDALAFFFRPQFDEAFNRWAKDIEGPDAGLPQEERAKRINELDAHIEHLEEELQRLYQQAADAGLSVTSEYVPL